MFIPYMKFAHFYTFHSRNKKKYKNNIFKYISALELTDKQLKEMFTFFMYFLYFLQLIQNETNVFVLYN